MSRRSSMPLPAAICRAGFWKANLFPRQLLRRIRRIENELGRKRGVLNGPRNIDIDILLYGMAIINADELEIPHPRFRERRFVLAPLAELAELNLSYTDSRR